MSSRAGLGCSRTVRASTGARNGELDHGKWSRESNPKSTCQQSRQKATVVSGGARQATVASGRQGREGTASLREGAGFFS